MVNAVQHGRGLLIDKVKAESVDEPAVDIGIVNEEERLDKVEFVLRGKSDVPGMSSSAAAWRSVMVAWLTP